MPGSSFWMGLAVRASLVIFYNFVSCLGPAAWLTGHGAVDEGCSKCGGRGGVGREEGTRAVGASERRDIYTAQRNGRGRARTLAGWYLVVDNAFGGSAGGSLCLVDGRMAADTEQKKGR